MLISASYWFHNWDLSDIINSNHGNSNLIANKPLTSLSSTSIGWDISDDLLDGPNKVHVLSLQ